MLVRNLPQLEAALAAGVATIYCELEDPKRYRDAMRLVRGLTHGGIRRFPRLPPRPPPLAPPPSSSPRPASRSPARSGF